MARACSPRRRAVVEHVHGVAFLLQAGLDETRDLPVVLDHEDAHTHPLSIRCLRRYTPNTSPAAIGPIVFSHGDVD